MRSEEINVRGWKDYIQMIITRSQIDLETLITRGYWGIIKINQMHPRHVSFLKTLNQLTSLSQNGCEFIG